MHKARRKQDVEEKTRSCREIRILSLWVIYRDPVVNFRGRRPVPFTRSVYATCVSRIRGFPAKSFRHREDCYELSKELRRDIRLARIPIGLFSPTARSFQLLPFGFLFSVVFLYEKRSAVSFPPDVAPSKDTGEHWTLLHEIQLHMFLPEYVRVRIPSSNSYRYSIVTLSRLRWL